MNKIKYALSAVLSNLIFRFHLDFNRFCFITVSLLFFNSSIVYSQKYKTIHLERENRVSGVVMHTDMPKNTTPFLLLCKKTKPLTFQKYDSTIRKSNKVLLFELNTNEFRNREILFINIVSKNDYPLLDKTPLISIFYDTALDSNNFQNRDFNYNYTRLTDNHVVSVEIDTIKPFLYLVLIFPQFFSDEFNFEIETKTRPPKPIIKSQFNFEGQIYFHPYDYEKKPQFFMEASIFSKQTEIIQAKIKLDNPAFEEPTIKEVNDSVFYDTFLKKFIELAILDSAIGYCEYPPLILIQLKFDLAGKLKETKISAFKEGPYPMITIGDGQNLIHLLKQSIPKYFIWNPAKNMFKENIPYTKEFLLYMDLCWN